MKTLLLILALATTLQAQDIMPCGTPEPPPNTLIISKQSAMNLAADNTIRTIPVVFHIVYNDPADSAMFAGGVNSQRIALQMDVMNKCFRAQNADISAVLAEFRSVIADCHIEFCLKQVIYKKTTITSFQTNNAMKELPTGSPAVDPFKHLNIWVARMCCVGGFAYYPVEGAVGQWFDGVVSHLPYVGNDDRRTGEVTVHEIGHYLFLAHTFNKDVICTGNPADLGDWCGDTPATDAPAGGCNLTRQACGHLTQNQNYMEYTDCSALFTLDQSARMTATNLGIRNALWNSGTCSGTPGNTPPVVSITFPANGQSFTTVPSNININVSATDANGTISKVEFYNGANLLSTDLTLPYSFVWPNVGAGSYTLTAKATDNGGASTTSTAISITVGTTTNIPPVCVVTNPANNAVIVLPAPVVFAVTATDADGTITKVEYFINNQLLTTQPVPYTITWSAPAGTYALKARATDNAGAVTTSQIVNITVTSQTNPPPVVSITSPTNGSTYTSPATITITATATDNTSISRVEFYAGTTLWATDNTSPFSTTKSMVGAGNYILAARAYDSQGASSISSPVTIIVTAGATDSEVVFPIIHKADGKLEITSKDGRKKIIQ